MAEGTIFRNLTLGQLFESLHNSLNEFVAGIDQAISLNEKVAEETISQLRDHIKERLAKGDESIDNDKLIASLELLSTDQKIIKLVKEDASGWLELLDLIEEKLESDESKLTADEVKDLRRIRLHLSEIKDLIRKQD